MKLHKETKVAIFVIIAGTMLYSGFNFLKGVDFFSTNRRYYAKYQNVDGLSVSNPVIVNGFGVGRVSDIVIKNDETQSLEVALDISNDVIIGDSTIAMIADAGLISGKCIKIKLGNVNKPLPNNSFLIADTEKGLSDKLEEKTRPIIDNLEITLRRINTVLSQDNIASISRMLYNLEQTSVALNKLVEVNGSNLASTTGSLQKLSASLVETEKQIKPLLVKANTLADSLNKMKLVATIENANKTVSQLNNLLTDINSGKGSVGKLLHDDSLYIYLNNSAKDLDKLMIDLKANPNRYVHFSLFGRKPDKN